MKNSARNERGQIGQGEEGKKLGLAKERLIIADGWSRHGMETQTIQI